MVSGTGLDLTPGSNPSSKSQDLRQTGPEDCFGGAIPEEAGIWTRCKRITDALSLIDHGFWMGRFESIDLLSNILSLAFFFWTLA